MRFFLPAIAFLLMSFFVPGNAGLTSQVWNLELVTFNSDTIFRRDIPEFTYRYNYKVNTWMKNKEDSLNVLEKSKENYANSESMKIDFVTDTGFQITKVRSGSKFYPSEMDFGSYEVRNDTVFMVNRSRKNKREILILSEKKDKLFLNDKGINYTTYMEYRKAIR